MLHIHTPAELAFLGLVLDYSGDRANASGRCAVYAVTPLVRSHAVHRLTEQGLQRLPNVDLTLDLVFEDGRTWRGWTTADLTDDRAKHNGFHRLYVTGGQLDSDQLAAWLARAAAHKATEAAMHDEAENAHQRECAQLLATHPELTRTGSDMPSAKAAAANARKLLKAAFPGVKFSVRSGRAGWSATLDVTWTDGPTPGQVDAITDQFKAGHFDGMADIYEHRRTAWTECFGSAEYVSTTRERSPALIQRAIDAVAAKHGRHDLPTVDDHAAGRTSHTSPMQGSVDHHWSWSSLIYRASLQVDMLAPAPVADEEPTAPAQADAAPQLVEHITRRGKTLQGVIRQDMTRLEAEALDPYTFRKDGGWFIRARHLGQS